MNMFKQIFDILTKAERKSALIFLLVTIAMAIVDVMGIASILPFMSVLSNPELIQKNTFLVYIYQVSKKIGVEDTTEFLFFLGSVVLFLLFISLILRAITTYVQARFANMREFSISSRLIESYLKQNYSWFLNQNSSELGKSILSEVEIIIRKTIVPMMNIVVHGMVAIFLIMLLILVDPILALSVGTILSLCYLMIFFLVKSLLLRIGEQRFDANKSRFKVVSETFGALKEVKIGGLEKFYSHLFKEPAKNYAKSQYRSTVISRMPKFFLEGIAFGGMVVMVLFLIASGKEFSSIAPLLALYALAGHRILPALQTIYSSFTELSYSKLTLNHLYNDLKSLPKIKDTKNSTKLLEFNNSIILNDICFSYSKDKQLALKNINLNIPALSKIGIVGTTGSGKTTVIDIIIGLLEAQTGTLKVDGEIIDSNNKRQWQNLIGYVPQQIYLSDDSIKKKYSLWNR